MSVEHIEELDTLNQGRLKINAILDQSNASAEKVDAYQVQLTNGISEAKNIADEAGKEAVQIATDAGNQANETANQAMNNAKQPSRLQEMQFQRQIIINKNLILYEMISIN